MSSATDGPLPADELDWAPVLAHLAWLSEDQPDVGRMVASELGEDGAWTWPYEELSERSTALVQELYDTGVVAAGIDWPSWLNTGGDELLGDDGPLIAEASLDDCRHLLVALVRGARFSEGALLEALRAGRIRRCLERVRELV